MNRETKIGLVVATTFLALLGIVVASKMRRPETPVADVRPGNDDHDSSPSGAPQEPKPGGSPGGKPGEPPPLTQTGGTPGLSGEPPSVVPAVGDDKPGNGDKPGGLGPFVMKGSTLPAIEGPIQSEAVPGSGSKPQSLPGTELPSVELPSIASPGVGEPKQINPPPVFGVGEFGSKPGVTVVPPPITPGKPEILEFPGLEQPKKESIPTGQLPKVDFPKTDAPKVEPPMVDLPKVDLPKVDLPKTELPKTELPKTDLPKTDLPKTDLPKTDLPKTELPKTDQPKIDVKISQPMPLTPDSKEIMPKPGLGGNDTAPSIGPPPLVPKTPIVERPIGTPMGELPVTSPVTPVAPGAGKALPAVTNHAEERTYAQPGETFEQMSQRLYGSPKYAPALLEYNRKHVLAKANILQNPPQLQPNQAIYWPDKNILEIQYGSLIGQAASAAPNAPTVKITPLGTPNPPTADPTVTLTLTQPRWVFDVARQTLGDGQRWVEILRLNPSLQTEQPIPAGTALRLPATAKLP